MNIKSHLRKVINLLQKGWCRYNGRRKINGKNHYCVTGAAHKTSKNAYLLIDKLNEISLREKQRNIVAFNDAAKNKREVIGFLRKCEKEIN